MIVTKLITIFLGILNATLSLLPTSDGFPDEVTTALQYVTSQALSWEYYFPVSTLFTVLALFLAYEFAIFTWHGIRWIIGVIRGSHA